jgi:hypothetical protein
LVTFSALLVFEAFALFADCFFTLLTALLFPAIMLIDMSEVSYLFKRTFGSIDEKPLELIFQIFNGSK